MNCVGKATNGMCGHPFEDHEGPPGSCSAHGCDCDGYVAPPQPQEEPELLELEVTGLPMAHSSRSKQVLMVPDGMIETTTIVTFYPKDKT